MRYLLPLAAALLLTGCGATMVSEPQLPETDKGGNITNHQNIQLDGTVYYMTSGMGFIVDWRHADAIDQINEACNGRYRIGDKEITSSEGAYYAQEMDNAVYDGVYIKRTPGYKYRYIDFTCIPESYHIPDSHK